MGVGGPSAELRFVGVVESSLAGKAEAPKQADEGAPPATLRIAPEFTACCEGLHAGDEVLVLTWLDRADRDVQAVHPRGDTTRPLTGVFATRAPVRPNPIGLHRVEIVAISGGPGDPRALRVDALEALDGTPILDLKPVLDADAGVR
ncbi:MAG TPA: tRNA (N6-threonylcarbamoyladenosine(37)-N6)-methyltransferase TrmO [Solirubrobacterales bacterium]|nr:tRNA (N6-threonylcarbamoyladenosine(37)-N6)-methyltransferase TrmO [Solirubrobacterales bacterium]